MSTRDLCGLDYIPHLIKAGVKCLKIEGRMKSPEYVATVTKIYRKYIDLAYSKNPYNIDPNDKKELLQIFNRGLCSSGHLDSKPNKDLVYSQKPNNMGLFLGIVQKYNKNRYITLKLNETLNIGDTIALENETGTYTISELMRNGVNIEQGEIGETVVIGRMKGKISLGNKLYKISSKKQLFDAKESFNKENSKVLLNCDVIIKKDTPISIRVTSANDLEIYKALDVNISLNFIPVEAKNFPLTNEKIIEQIGKTTSTPYSFNKISIELDENLFLPKISSLNELRRSALIEVEKYASNNIQRQTNKISIPKITLQEEKKSRFLFVNKRTRIPRVAVLLNILNLKFNYQTLENINDVYIPLKYFFDKKYSDTLRILSSKFNMYIYMPTITKSNYKNLAYESIKQAIENYHIHGFIISNLSNILLLKEFKSDFKFVANYTFNIFNQISIDVIKSFGITGFTLSPELDKKNIISLCNDTQKLEKEIIVYGNVPVLNMNYCVLGKSNKCYPDCKQYCKTDSHFYLEDRLKMKFMVIPDNLQNVTTVYNSKTTSITFSDFDVDTTRIDILDESINRINNIVNTVKKGKRFEGKEYTNGNLNRNI